GKRGVAPERGDHPVRGLVTLSNLQVAIAERPAERPVGPPADRAAQLERPVEVLEAGVEVEARVGEVAPRLRRGVCRIDAAFAARARVEPAIAAQGRGPAERERYRERAPVEAHVQSQ